MKCPNCGNDIPDHSLYCEQCGEDIHIVPDFEAAVEANIHSVIQGIVDEISDGASSVKEEEKKQKKRIPRALVTTILMVILIVLIGILTITYVKDYQSKSFHYQVLKAQESIADGNTDKAIEYYRRALQLDNTNVRIKFTLAELYFNNDIKDEYETILLDIIHSSDVGIEDLNSAYGRLIAIYRSREDYEAIKDLVLASNNEFILNSYQDYIAKEPVFNLKGGYYTEIQPIKIQGSGEGQIFYTINGEEPIKENSKSIEYKGPIILDEGDYAIRAIYYNELGIASNIVTEEYHFKFDQIAAPNVGTVSGNYEFPVDIDLIENSGDVHYTMDGTDPTADSPLFLNPIPMPLGNSIFKFVRIKNGKSSEIIIRTYELDMHTEYTVEEACKDILLKQQEYGKIADEAGFSPDGSLKYEYRYLYVTKINDIDDFYVFEEWLVSEDGTESRTGDFYAANAYLRTIYKLVKDEGNNYLLVEIQTETREG